MDQDRLGRRLTELGAYIRRRREEKGLKLADVAGHISKSLGYRPDTGYLSHIERAYKNPKRGWVVPGDDYLEAIAEALDIPVTRLHQILGRAPAFFVGAANEDRALRMLELYSGLRESEKIRVERLVETLSLAEKIDREGSVGHQVED